MIGGCRYYQSRGFYPVALMIRKIRECRRGWGIYHAGNKLHDHCLSYFLHYLPLNPPHFPPTSRTMLAPSPRSRTRHRLIPLLHAFASTGSRPRGQRLVGCGGPVVVAVGVVVVVVGASAIIVVGAAPVVVVGASAVRAGGILRGAGAAAVSLVLVG